MLQCGKVERSQAGRDRASSDQITHGSPFQVVALPLYNVVNAPKIREKTVENVEIV
jgi:hypothetical protein